MIRNVRGHRIRWTALLARGVVVGLISALVMLVVAMVSFPLFERGSDMWTFSKVIAAVFLPNDTMQLTSFEAGPVLLGTLLHFLLGAFAGATYAAIVGMFDLEGWTPVAMMGIVYGAGLFITSATLIGVLSSFDDAAQNLPLVVMFWGNVAFGITAGALMATWADRADIDQDEAERVPAFEGQQDLAGMHR